MRYLRAFEQLYSLDAQRLLDCILFTEAMYCRVHEVAASRDDGVVETLADSIAAFAVSTKA